MRSENVKEQAKAQLQARLANFIVRACNAHEELLCACKAALEMFNDSMFIWGKDDNKKVCHMTKALAHAITKAEAHT